jgi:hypothetical protein
MQIRLLRSIGLQIRTVKSWVLEVCGALLVGSPHAVVDSCWLAAWLCANGRQQLYVPAAATAAAAGTVQLLRVCCVRYRFEGALARLPHVIALFVF